MGLAAAQNQPKIESSKSVKQSNTKTKEIDRFDFLNDQFDFDGDDLGNQPLQQEDDFDAGIEFLEKKHSEELKTKE